MVCSGTPGVHCEPPDEIETVLRDLVIQTMYSSGMSLFLTVTAAMEDDTDGMGISCCPLEVEGLYEWNGDEAALT